MKKATENEQVETNFDEEVIQDLSKKNFKIQIKKWKSTLKKRLTALTNKN